MRLAKSLPARLARAVRRAMAATLAVFVVYTAYSFLSADPDGTLGTVLNDWVYNALLLGTAGLCLARGALVREQRLAWIAFGAGLLVWSLGDIYWTIFTPSGVSPADALYLAFLPLAYGGWTGLVRGRVPRFQPSMWLDGLIGGLGVAAVGAALAFEAILHATGGGTAIVAVNLAYPLGDLLLMGFVVGGFALTGWRLERSWLLIGAGLLTMAVADTVYLYRAATDSYVVGTPLDAAWPGGMVLLAYAAWQAPAAPEPVRAEGWRALLFPFLFSIGALALLVYGNVAHLPRLALVLAAATVVAAVVRTALAFREVRALTELRRLAMTDDLTDLPNRRFLYEHLAEVIEAGRTLALLVVGLDRFKEVNETLGHQAGDALIRQVGPRLQSAVGRSHVLVRLGGAEFGVLLDDVRAAQEARDVAARLRAALDRPFPVAGIGVHVEASVGIALHPDHAATADELFQRADVALSHAKSTGGYELYATERDQRSREQVELLGELRGAIDDGQIVLHYQPQAEAETGRVVGVEALARWQHPERGLLGPHEFLPLAERSAIMRPLTLAVLDQALAQASRWQASGLDLTVSVNLAAPNLVDTDLCPAVEALLRRWDLEPGRLRLEITENTAMLDPARALEVLAALKGLGCEIALDDFGTGRASLAYLKELPVDELKIDRSFVMAMGSSPDDAAIVRSTVDLARRLGLRVVAEGVESAAEWGELRVFGCHLIQGFHLARPMPADELATWLAEWQETAAGEIAA